MNKELNNQEFVYKFENLDLYRSLVGPMNVNLKMLMLEIDDIINEISINSPIGKTIYKQCVGFKGTYTVEENEFQVTILSKLTKEEAYNELGIKLLEKK